MGQGLFIPGADLHTDAAHRAPADVLVLTLHVQAALFWVEQGLPGNTGCH